MKIISHKLISVSITCIKLNKCKKKSTFIFLKQDKEWNEIGNGWVTDTWDTL